MKNIMIDNKVYKNQVYTQWVHIQQNPGYDFHFRKMLSDQLIKNASIVLNEPIEYLTEEFQKQYIERYFPRIYLGKNGLN